MEIKEAYRLSEAWRVKLKYKAPMTSKLSNLGTGANVFAFKTNVGIVIYNRTMGGIFMFVTNADKHFELVEKVSFPDVLDTRNHVSNKMYRFKVYEG